MEFDYVIRCDEITDDGIKNISDKISMNLKNIKSLSLNFGE